MLQAREVRMVSGDLAGARGRHDLPAEFREQPHEVAFSRVIEPCEVLVARLLRVEAPGFRVAENRTDACVRVLHVVDRILVAARQGQIDIKSELRGGCAGNQKIASSVAAYPIDQIAERYVAPGPFGQFDLCPLSSAMESNRDEALRCVRLAEKYLLEGGLDKASRFALKSNKLYPNDKAKGWGKSKAIHALF